MRRRLAAWMVVLWCIGVAGVAPGHGHVWVTGPDGHIHIAHAVVEHMLDPAAFDVHKHDQAISHQPVLAEPLDDHGHRLTVVQGNDTSPMPTASAVPPPSQKPAPHPPILAMLLPLCDRPGEGTFVGSDPPRPPPNFLQHRSVVLLI